ncbi:hypothetical protein JCM15415_04130 [Methanobacterium movens]
MQHSLQLIRATKRVNEPRGPEAKTRHNKEGEWAKKNGKSNYGYKLHTLADMNYGLDT